MERLSNSCVVIKNFTNAKGVVEKYRIDFCKKTTNMYVTYIYYLCVEMNALFICEKLELLLIKNYDTTEKVIVLPVFNSIIRLTEP